MVIVYESKTGFTKKYAEMLADKTGMHLYPANEITKLDRTEELLFLGWMKVGKIQGLQKVKKHKIAVVCGCGTGRSAEPDVETILARNKLVSTPFFYLRGGCLPLSDIQGVDRFALSMFVRMLKSRNDGDEKTAESIEIIEKGFDGVDEENLSPLLDWLRSKDI
ncbi:MAG TPA: flavodoxin domain-containing protein [Clostridia bacterium]|nr:flavodoxin domain-containing protein [Clostridia bacterium]